MHEINLKLGNGLDNWPKQVYHLSLWSLVVGQLAFGGFSKKCFGSKLRKMTIPRLHTAGV